MGQVRMLQKIQDHVCGDFPGQIYPGIIDHRGERRINGNHFQTEKTLPVLPDASYFIFSAPPLLKDQQVLGKRAFVFLIIDLHQRSAPIRIFPDKAGTQNGLHAYRPTVIPHTPENVHRI